MYAVIITTLYIYIYFFFYLYGDHRDLHSFPTRRSSDLAVRAGARAAVAGGRSAAARTPDCRAGRARSEEHTSELQSLTKLVCRLLLEKKKKTSNDKVEQDYNYV